MALRVDIAGGGLGLVCLVIVAANIYQAVKQALQDLVAPQIESLKGEIGQLRGEVHGEIAEFRGEVHGQIAELRSEMKGNHAAVSAEIVGLRGEMGELRGEVRGAIVELRSEMRGNHATVSADIRRIDDKLTWALDLRERIVALETKLAVAPARP